MYKYITSEIAISREKSQTGAPDTHLHVKLKSSFHYWNISYLTNL